MTNTKITKEISKLKAERKAMRKLIKEQKKLSKVLRQHSQSSLELVKARNGLAGNFVKEDELSLEGELEHAFDQA